MKRIVKTAAIGICVGVLLVIVKESFQIDEAVFKRTCWIAAPVAVIGALLINIFYNISYQNKVRKIARMLDEEKPQEYIDGMEVLLRTAKGKNLRNVLQLNLAAGYLESKQFDTAIVMLEELSDGHLQGSGVNAAHRINLCMAYFETGQFDKAMVLYHESQVFFQKYRNGKIYGASIAVLDIWAAINNEQYGQAEELLAMASKTYVDSRFQKAFHEIAHKLSEIKNSRHEV